MSRKITSLLVILLLTFSVSAQEKTSPALNDERAFNIYDSRGRAATLEDVVEATSGTDVAFIGETHDDPGAHAFEVELLKRAFARYSQGDEKKSSRPLILSLEMFERDVQLILDEYLAGLISERHFLASSRPWKNYQTDYKPLVEFARAHKIPVIASNAPARYVSLVSQKGPSALRDLSRDAKRAIPQLPYAAASDAYAKKFSDFMRSAHEDSGTPKNPASPSDAKTPAAQAAHSTPNLLDAQNLRDAAMGYSIAEALKRRERALVLHVNGAFHSEEGLGAPEHVRRYRKKARVLIITIIPANDFDGAKISKLGDFIVLTRKAAPKS